MLLNQLLDSGAAAVPEGNDEEDRQDQAADGGAQGEPPGGKAEVEGQFRSADGGAATH